jgi:hypothetical protein
MKVIYNFLNIIVDAMSLLIEKVLSDPETRERLLDHSVLSDFYFEEKLKEKRMQVL